MENKNQSAFPCHSMVDGQLTVDPNKSGLTKREFLAGLAMQGWIACQHEGFSGEPESIAQRSIACADELLKALNQE